DREAVPRREPERNLAVASTSALLNRAVLEGASHMPKTPGVSHQRLTKNLVLSVLVLRRLKSPQEILAAFGLPPELHAGRWHDAHSGALPSEPSFNRETGCADQSWTVCRRLPELSVGGVCEMGGVMEGFCQSCGGFRKHKL